MKIMPCGQKRESEAPDDPAKGKKDGEPCGHSPADECHCACHKPGSKLRHCKACCHDCKKCGRRIRG